MIKELYLFVQDKTKNTGIKNFDWWNRQFATQDDEDPFPSPALFFEILPFETTKVGSKRHTAVITFRLHLGQQLYDRTVKGAKRQSAALDHMNILDRVFNSLEGKNNGTTIGSITRTGIAPDHNFVGYIVHSQTFSARMTSDAAVKAMAPAHGNAKVTSVTIGQ